MLVTNAAMRTRMAQVAVDVCAGTDLTGYGMSAGLANADVSGWVVVLHDGSDALNPPANGVLRANLASGTVNAIISTSPNQDQPQIVELDVDHDLQTVGTLPQDPTFGLLADVHPITFLPPGDSGYLSLHAIGSRLVSGRTRLYLKDLSTQTAHPNQFHTPAAGWRYNLANPNAGVFSPDWDADGDNRDITEFESYSYAAGIAGYRDEVNSLMNTAVGHGSTLSVNGLGGTNVRKRVNGLKTPHPFTDLFDIAQGEFMNDNGGFIQNGSDGYNIQNSQMERLMRAWHLSSSCIREEPFDSFMNQWQRGPLFEIQCRGENYQYAPNLELDANFIRFHWAVAKTLPRTGHILSESEIKNDPFAIDEFYLDLDTNWVQPAPLGTYTEDGGATGSSGFNVGSWAWGPVDAGDRIMIRRFGGFLVPMNMDDSYSGYNLLAPPQLDVGWDPTVASGSARSGNDEITPADFTALYTSGLLQAGETLRHLDPPNYDNERVTAHLRANSSRDWSAPNFYGSRADHPDDGTFTKSNAPWLATDDILNNNAVVDQAQSYFLAVMQSVVWQIVAP